MQPIIFSPSEPLLCRVPESLHPACANLIDQFVTGKTSVDMPAYVCNMVDSALIPFVHCLVNVYGNGTILLPPGM